MKIQNLRVCLQLLAVGMLTGCVMEPNGQLGFQPIVFTPGPVAYAPPVVEEPPAVLVPDSYVWDGTEYVGVVGDQYMYLGPDNVWLVCEPDRLERFHGWERFNPDWRDRAVRNDRFRDVREGRREPGRAEPQKAAPKKKKEGT